MSIKAVDGETLNGAVEFYSPFRIVGTLESGRATIEDADLLEPEVTLFVDRDGQGVGAEDVSLNTWEPVTGYSGQHGYSGPVMHPSEFLGGRMAQDVLGDVGAVYSLAVVECLPDWEDATDDERDEMRDGDPAGWMLLKYTGA